MVKRVPLILVLLSIATAGLFATGDQEKTAEGRVLEAVRWGGEQAFVVPIEEAWNAEFPDSKLEINLGFPHAEYIATRIAANNLPDLFWTRPYTEVWSLAKRGLLMDLSNEPFVKKLIPSTPIEAVSYEGKIYAYPFLTGYMALFYNMEMFAKAGIAEERKTISDLKSMIGKIESLGVRPFATSHKSDQPLHEAFTQMMDNAIGKEDHSNWISAMNDGQQTFGIPKFAGLMEAWDLMIKHGTPKSMDADYNQMTIDIGKQKAAMFLARDGHWVDFMKIDKDLMLGAMGAPISEDPNDTLMGADIQTSIAVSKKTKNWDLVQRFFNWATEPQYWNEGNLTVVFAFRAGLPWVPYDGPFNPKGGVIEDATNYQKQGWVVPWIYNQKPVGFDEALTSILQSYYLGKLDVDEMVRQLDEAWHSLAAKAKK